MHLDWRLGQKNGKFKSNLGNLIRLCRLKVKMSKKRGTIQRSGRTLVCHGEKS